MLIINADDLGRSRAETDAALRCFSHGRISSTTAMVFMADSERAAALARESGIDVGLHLNFDERFTGCGVPESLAKAHEQTSRYLTRSKLTQLVCNPLLRSSFGYSYKRQTEEFERVFRIRPSHTDGHHHMHVCANVAFGNIIPYGTKLRRTFSFSAGEKSLVNRAYRRFLDRTLRRKYKMPDYFFDLSQSIAGGTTGRVIALSGNSVVELMTHPVNDAESDYLLTREFGDMLGATELGTYAALDSANSEQQTARVTACV